MKSPLARITAGIEHITAALGRRRLASEAEAARVTEGVRLIAGKPERAPGRHRAPEQAPAAALTPPVDPWAGAAPMRRQIGAGWGVPAWRGAVFA